MRLLGVLLLIPFFGLQSKQFVSTDLCLDRLLIALADQSQIASMTFLSKDPHLMLDKVNLEKDTNDGKLSSLIRFKNDTILMNSYNQTKISRLKELGFDVKIIRLPETKEQLIQVIQEITDLTGNAKKADELIDQLKPVKQKFKGRRVLGIAEQGVVYKDSKTFNQLIQLVGLENVLDQKDIATDHKLSLEELLLLQSDMVFLLSYDQSAYSKASALLSHDAIAWISKNKPTLYLSSRYTLCFDQGIWQGAHALQEKY